MNRGNHQTLRSMTTDNVNVTIPANYTGNTMRIIVDKEKVKEEKHVNFISFNIQSTTLPGYLSIGAKYIELRDFYDMLREKGGLSDRLPIVVTLDKPLAVVAFDERPPSYNGQRVWPFKWNNQQCSLTGNVTIRVHHASLEVAEETMQDIRNETLKLWKENRSVLSLPIYIPIRNGNQFQWIEYGVRGKRDLNTIYIDSRIKDRLVNGLTKFLSSSALYDRYGVTWKRIYLFNGPPGTGKTSTVLALSSLFNKGIAKMTITPDMTSSSVELLFRAVAKDTFLLLEDVDSLFVERTSTSHVDFSTVLNLMDGITTRRGLVLFMTTNHIEKLDSAFVRPGRVDEVVQFKTPGREEFLASLKMLGERWPDEHEACIN
jgi:hypothetical protein